MLRNISTQGFTLIELMMVIVIVAVLLAIASPSVKSMIDKQRVKGTCEVIYQNIALARSSTVSLNRNVTFKFDDTGASWCMGVYDATATTCNCSTTAASACTVNGIKRTASYSDFGGSTITVTPGIDVLSVAFSARDAAPTTPIDTTGSNGDIEVVSNFWACKLRVEPLGQVRYLKTGSGEFSRGVVPAAEVDNLTD